MTAGQHPIEFALVLACLRWPQGPAEGERIRHLAQQPVRWPHLLDIARHHKVEPLIARSLEAFAPGLVPEGPAALLRNANIENAHTCLRRIGHLLSLTQQFGERQVDVRIFKGIPLSMLAFHDPTLRDAGDIDLLVAEKDIFAAGEILRDAGYVRFQPQGRLTPRRLRSYIAHQKDFSYHHPTAGIVIDLHWRLFRNHWLPANGGLAQLGEHFVELSTEALPTLTAPQLLPYLCMHGALDGWLRLKWLVDIQALLHAMPPEQIAMAVTTAAGQQSLPQLSAAIYLCQDLLGYETPAPQPLLAACLHRDHPLVSQILSFSHSCMSSNDYCPAREQIPSTRWFLNEFRQHDSLRYRLDLLARSLFRPRVWSWVQLPDWLFPFYVLLSPFEWLDFHLRRFLMLRSQASMGFSPRTRKSWWRRRPRDLALAAEAACMLSFFRVALRFLPVQKLIAWMSWPSISLPLARERQTHTLRRVEWSIAAIVRHAPLTFVCFPQCLAAYFMLRRRHIASTLFYGVTRKNDQLKAHTWVKVGDRTVIGGDEAASFTVLNTFP